MRQTSNPRVKIHKSGHATLSGFNYDDLRTILTAASLWRYQEAKQRKHGEREGCACDECFAWEKAQRAFVDMALASMDAAIRGTHPPRQPPTKAQRLAAVREEIRFRKTMDKLLEQARAHG